MKPTFCTRTKSSFLYCYILYAFVQPFHKTKTVRRKPMVSQGHAASCRTGGEKAFLAETGPILAYPLPEWRRVWIPCIPAWSSRSLAGLPTSYQSTRRAIVLCFVVKIRPLIKRRRFYFPNTPAVCVCVGI